MHYRENIREKVTSWGGGLAGAGYPCQLCDFKAGTKDSLVTHAGYKHALFVEFLSEEGKKSFFEIVDRIGDKSELNKKGASISSTIPCPKCNVSFGSQLELASHMTNVNCQAPSNNQVTSSVLKCLLCDFEVGSALLYKCHLLVHYHEDVEKEVAGSFKENQGICKDCDPDGQPMELADFARHFAVDHDRIFNFASLEVRNHLSSVFPGSDAIIR